MSKKKKRAKMVKPLDRSEFAVTFAPYATPRLTAYDCRCLASLALGQATAHAGHPSGGKVEKQEAWLRLAATLNRAAAEVEA